MGKRKVKEAPLLRVVPTEKAECSPLVLHDAKARREFAKLTQDLVEIAIEIVDLVEGDPDIEVENDLEPGGDEEEDSDGL